MPTTTPNFGWSVPVSTDLVKDGATAIELLGDSIDTSLVDLKGGTTGQVLAKASGTDMDFSWVAQDDSNAIQNAIVDAKGDLIGATAADTPARLAVGTNGQVLTADSAESTGLKWATPAPGGGKVLQVVQGSYATSTTISSASFTDSGLSLSITPTLATSKILVLVSQSWYLSRSSNQQGHAMRIMRGATSVFETTSNLTAGYFFNSGSTSIELAGYIAFTYLDSPATTSATTYKTQGLVRETAGQVRYQYVDSPSTITLLEIGA
jgi:hypothetical protein